MICSINTGMFIHLKHCTGRGKFVSDVFEYPLPSHSFDIEMVLPLWGAGIAEWLECRTRDRKVAVRIPAGAAGEFSSPGSTFCADSYFSIRSTPMLPQ